MNARVERLFHEVADLSAEARTQYFAENGVDEETRREVEALLSFDARASGSLERDVIAAAGWALTQIEARGRHCGPFRLLDVVGRGGMGAVYLAERADGEVTQRVAVKLLPPGAGAPQRERFLQERQILATLAHPNIARMLDAGHLDNGQPFLVMEYVNGKPIDVFAAEFSVRQKIALFLKVCAAVAYSHRNLVVHRDLKPSNILVTVDGEPKLLDFGIAKILDLTADSTITSMRMLTPDYASPEQVMRGRVSTATDIYSLGAVLYRLLTGKPPHEFEDHSPEAIASVIMTREVTRPSTLAPELKGDIEVILLKALRKDAHERYATVEQFAEDLEAFLKSRPVRARSGNTWYRTRKFLRRYWLSVSAASLAVISLLVGLTVANRERNRAVTEKRRADDEAATAKAVSDFLQRDLLAQASANTQAGPDTKPDPDLKVRTALDRAAARIAGKFEKQPLVEAATRQTIGNTYKDLGLYPEAQGQLERARALRARVLGEEHPDTLSAMRDLAEVYSDAGKNAQAETLQAEALEIQRRVLGGEHPNTLSTMNDLAVAYERDAKYAQAETLQAKALEIQRRVLGEEHPDTLASMNNLALVYYDEGKYAQAEALHVKKLEIGRRVLGEEHPDTLRSMNNLALTYSSEGRYGQAEALHARVLEMRRRVLGEEHSNTLNSMDNLAFVYGQEGKHGEAVALQAKGLEIRQRVLGVEHPDTLRSMQNLATLYRRQAKYALAEPLYLQVLEISRRVLGPQHPDTTDTMASLSELRLLEHRYTESEPLLREALNTLQQTSRDSWKRYYLESLLGATFTGQRRYPDAEPLLLSGYAGMIQRKTTMRADSKSNLTQAGEWIVQLYRDWGQPDKATEWQAKLESEKAGTTPAPRQ